MRDHNALNPMHIIMYKYRAVNKRSRSNNDFEKYYRRHLPCILNRKIQYLYQEKNDRNCLFWTLMIALGRVPDGFSHESRDLYVSQAALNEIQTMRSMMVGWWRSRPDAELYSPKWRWMVTLKKYYCQVSTRAAREVATAAQRGETNYVTFIINELKLQHSNEIQEVVSRRLIELFRELHRAIVARGYRNDRDYDFRKAVHVLLDQWSNEVVTGNGTSSTGREDEGEIDETLLRRTFAIIVLSKIEDEFANLRLFENGYRFHAAELDNMEQMNVDAKTEEFIAAAAVFQKPIVILDLFYVDDDMWHNEDLDKMHAGIEQIIVKVVGGFKEQPYILRDMEWKDARRLVEENNAILIGMTQRHVEPTCVRTGPAYFPATHSSIICSLGYILRSTRNVGTEIAKCSWTSCTVCDKTVDKSAQFSFMYALVLACRLIKQPAFRYCCDTFKKCKDLWDSFSKLKVESIEWWLQQTNEVLVSIHKKCKLRFVYEVNASNTPKHNDAILSETLRLSMRGLRSQKFVTWETAYALSNMLHKRIFVVRGLDNIRAYGSPEVNAKVEWENVIDDLRDGSGVCCFTSATSDNDNFDVTHVAVPLWTSEKVSRGTGSSTCSKHTLDCTTTMLSTSESGGDACIALTLEEADLLMCLHGSS